MLVAGAFDLIHPGHIKMLEEAKKLGGKDSRLVVVIARDETVKMNKGRDPIFDEAMRRYMVSMLKPVDEAILGYKPPSFEKVIEKVKPDIVVFGYDQEELMEKFKRFCEEKGVRVEIRKAERYSLGRLNSSSDILKRILDMLGDKG